MKIYAEEIGETDRVEVLLNHQELKELLEALRSFEKEIEQYKRKNSGKEDLGFTHLHFIDSCPIGKNSKTDIVFYVDMNRGQGGQGDGSPVS